MYTDPILQFLYNDRKKTLDDPIEESNKKKHRNLSILCWHCALRPITNDTYEVLTNKKEGFFCSIQCVLGYEKEVYKLVSEEHEKYGRLSKKFHEKFGGNLDDSEYFSDNNDTCDQFIRIFPNVQRIPQTMMPLFKERVSAVSTVSAVSSAINEEKEKEKENEKDIESENIPKFFIKDFFQN